MLCFEWARIPSAPEPRRALQSDTAYALLDRLLRQNGLTGGPISRTDRGRPYFASAPHIDFSIAHTEFAVFCVVVAKADSHPPRVGLDAEPCNSLSTKKALALAERFFAPEELRYVNDAPDAVCAFLEVFTRKEAYAKYHGGGLAATLSADTMNLTVCNGLGIRFHTFIRENHHISLCLPLSADPVTL